MKVNKPWRETQCGTCKYKPKTCPFIKKTGDFSLQEGLGKLVDILYGNKRCHYRRVK